MAQQPRALATRAQIVRGAAEVFDRFGYEGARLSEITDAAGMTKGALYFHFSSKEDLARFVIAEQHRISISAVEAIGGEPVSALEQIVMLCHEMARQIVEDPIVRAGIRITLELSADDRGPAGPYLDWIAACQGLAVRAVSEGGSAAGPRSVGVRAVRDRGVHRGADGFAGVGAPGRSRAAGRRDVDDGAARGDARRPAPPHR